MSLQTVDLIGDQIIRQGWCAENVTIIWHAGEPTVIGPSWYHDAFTLLQEHCPPNVQLTHSFQTNGTLLNNHWIDLYKAWNVRIGVSIDGPQALHDANRRARDGRGTWVRTLKGIHLLQEAGIPFHVITVLTKESMVKAQELFDFYQFENIRHVCFNVEETEGANSHSSLDSDEMVLAFRYFLDAFMQCMQTAKHPIWVREFAYGLATIIQTGVSILSNQQVTPLAILSVDVNGALSTFSPELLGTSSKKYGNFFFSTLQEGGVPAVLCSETFLEAYEDIQSGVKACEKNCEWFRWCGGGAPANKFFENGSLASTETMYCRLTKKTVLESLLSAVENNTLPGMLETHDE
jgi:uncharacterized protein